jgi:hypothetical protein
MRILKSRVEMTPEELIKSRAGQTCACACQEGFDSEQLFVNSEIGSPSSCFCGCIDINTPESSMISSAGSAAKYVELY